MEGTNTLFFSHKISLGTRKDFFEIHRQFGHASSKRFGSSGLGYEMDGRETLIRFSALSRNFCLFQSVKSCGGCWSSYTLSYWGTATTAAWEWSSVLRIRVFGAVPPLLLHTELLGDCYHSGLGMKLRAEDKSVWSCTSTPLTHWVTGGLLPQRPGNEAPCWG